LPWVDKSNVAYLVCSMFCFVTPLSLDV
jgi:hypothetical protein